MDPKEELREAVREDLTNNDFGCPQCDSKEFEVDVWGVGDGIRGEEARAAAVCGSCGARLNVPVDSDLTEGIL
jgi:transcription elongation factor Elf1